MPRRRSRCGTGSTRRRGPTRARVTGSVSSRTPSSSMTTAEWPMKSSPRRDATGAVRVPMPRNGTPDATVENPGSAPAAPRGVRVEPHTAVGLAPTRPRDQVGALGHLVLEPADVGVLRRQLDRLGRRQDGLDGVLGLAHRSLARVDLEREDRGQARLHLRDRVALEDIDRDRALLGVAQHRRLLLVLVAKRHHDVRLVDVAGDHDGELQITDGLLEALPADALRQDVEGRQRRAARDEDGPTIRAFLGTERKLVEIVIFEIVRVDRSRPVLRLQRIEGTGRLVAPGLLALKLAGLAGARLRCGRESATFERPAVGQVASDEWRGSRGASSPGARGAGRRVPATRRRREPLTGDRACPATLRNGATGRRLATRSATGRAPATGRSRSVPRAHSASTVRLPVAAVPVRAVAAPTRLHPPRGAGPDQPRETFRAELLARRGPRPTLRTVHALLVAPPKLGRDLIASEHRVDGLGDVRVDGDPFAVDDLDDHVERRRRLALENALLGPPPARLLVAEGHALDPADQVGQRRVQHEV